MRRHTEKEILKVKNLRITGKHSYAYLAQLTGIPQTTIGHWFRDDEQIPRKESLLTSNVRRREIIKTSEVHILKELKQVDVMYLKILVAVMYWCEGSKYPATNSLTLVNSDPELIYSFICLLRKAFAVDESKFMVHLQIHTTHNFDEMRKYWSELLKINPSQFIKPTITSPNGKKHRDIYRGTCTVRYYDYRLQLKLMGLYEAFAKKLISM